MQIISRCHTGHPPEWLPKKRTKYGQGRNWCSYFVGENVNCYNQFGKLPGGMHLTQCTHSFTNRHVLECSQQHSVITPDWKLPKLPLPVEWIKYGLVTWRNATQQREWTYRCSQFARKEPVTRGQIVWQALQYISGTSFQSLFPKISS